MLSLPSIALYSVALFCDAFSPLQLVTHSLVFLHRAPPSPPAYEAFLCSQLPAKPSSPEAASSLHHTQHLNPSAVYTSICHPTGFSEVRSSSRALLCSTSVVPSRGPFTNACLINTIKLYEPVKVKGQAGLWLFSRLITMQTVSLQHLMVIQLNSQLSRLL